jgi:hypothetical protein
MCLDFFLDIFFGIDDQSFDVLFGAVGVFKVCTWTFLVPLETTQRLLEVKGMRPTALASIMRGRASSLAFALTSNLLGSSSDTST